MNKSYNNKNKLQKCLNNIDSEERNKNVIIMGVPEEDINLIGNITLKNDYEKISHILRITENNYFSNDAIENPIMKRLVAEKAGYNRIIKITLPFTNDRNEFIKNSIKLKDSGEPWKKIFIKKDQHPVYLAENNRLRKKLHKLKQTAGYENKEIKIVDGKLLVDKIPIDKNSFFH